MISGGGHIESGLVHNINHRVAFFGEVIHNGITWKYIAAAGQDYIGFLPFMVDNVLDFWKITELTMHIVYKKDGEVLGGFLFRIVGGASEKQNDYLQEEYCAKYFHI